VVLEDDAGGTALDGDADAGGGVLQHLAVDLDPTAVEGHEAGDGAQEGGLARAVGPHHGHHLPVGDLQADVEVESAQAQVDVGAQGHGVPSQRSRSRTRTARETASSTSDSATAPSGLSWRAT
jgi:hypothetical protein